MGRINTRKLVPFFVCDFMPDKGVISIIPFQIEFLISFIIEFFYIYLINMVQEQHNGLPAQHTCP